MKLLRPISTPVAEVWLTLSNCETNVRPVLWSVNRIGSPNARTVFALISGLVSHIAPAGDEQSSHVTLSIDARNPRTAGRELPSGQLSVAQVVVFCGASLALFLAAVWQLDPLVRWLWPIPVIGFVVYPYLKRFTWLCHFWLGVVDGLAPVGAWVAITGRLPWQAWMLGAAVALWVGGFDLFYALFDDAVDRQQGLHSVVTRFGVRGAFLGARIAHAATVACLVAAGLGLSVGVLYWLGVAAVAVLLAYEHSLVRPTDLRRLDTAFFTMNGVISVAFAIFVVADAVT